MAVKKLALVSVSDKTGLADFVKQLDELGFEIVSTGGTARAVEEAGVKVVSVEKLTGFPEILDGRVKTLHPKIHAGILADRSKKEHLEKLEEHGIQPIGLVVVNLYPFKETIANGSVSLKEAVEGIDIGGPSLVRAAAKNHESVAVVTSPGQYASVLEELRKNKGCISMQKRQELAARAFEMTAAYDATISSFLHNRFLPHEKFPLRETFTLEKVKELRYGENWHQKAALYKYPLASGLVKAEQLNGKEMSFNNYNDANAALSLVQEFNEAGAVIIKHANPCGVAVAENISDAFKNALECDRTSAFGSVIALNRECDSATAMQVASFFNEVLIAPSFDETAMQVLKKKKNLRILEMPGLGEKHFGQSLSLKPICGGVLLQTPDEILLNESELKVVSKKKPSHQEMLDLKFAWAVAKHAKSNAIVLAKGLATVGIGAGQMSRIDSTEIAVKKSNGRCKDSVLASDSFFPFRDNVDLAAKSGITAIIQPGGSIQDKEVIKAANEHGIAMLFTGIRHFNH